MRREEWLEQIKELETEIAGVKQRLEKINLKKLLVPPLIAYDLLELETKLADLKKRKDVY